ncbi:MAG TPA: DNA-3-methyladenine glycosylase 2 family protein [Pseudonocardia sp.]
MTTSATGPSTFTLHPRGAFSLRESAEFGFGQRDAAVFDSTMRLAFCADDLVHQVGVAVTQDEDGVHGRVVGAEDMGAAGDGATIERVAAQTARMLSLDVDARGYEAVGARDPVIARALAAAPGLRPPLFHSPYEAAAWCVLSLRWSGRQASAVRDRLAAAHGRVVEVAGVSMAAFPTPAQLLAVQAFDGVPPVKMDRLHGVATAAEAGLLDPEVLRRADPEEATARLRQIPGIGPFSASLILLRASGVCDVAVEHEPRLTEIVGRLYDLPGPATAEDLRRISEAWRPFRTWVGVLLRAASSRMPQDATVS